MDVERTVDALWRIEAPKLIASMARVVGDLGVAEDLVADAFVAAMEQWPHDGVPPRPGAWLMSTARHKAVDRIRREDTALRKYAVLAIDLDGSGTVADIADDALEPIPDDMLALVFTACHPVLPRDSRVALTLRVVAGLRTEEIARAFLVPSPTIGQRISRAKRTLAEARVPFESPSAAELPARLGTVLEVVYAVFNEGYSSTGGQELIRRDLADEAMRLGRILTGLMPDEPEVFGLVALMELQASRFATRVGPDGLPVQLEDQPRHRWDRALINHGLSMLTRATSLGRPLGPYTIQAAIAACHARARTFAATDWEAIVALYDALGQLAPSPVVDLNRAVAVIYTDGPEAALVAVDRLRDDRRLAGYHLLGVVRGDILSRLERWDEAAAELERAADLAPTLAERTLLRRRMADALGRAT